MDAAGLERRSDVEQGSGAATAQGLAPDASSSTRFTASGEIEAPSVGVTSHKRTASEQAYDNGEPVRPPLNMYQVDPRDLTPVQVAEMIREQPNRAQEIQAKVAEARGPAFMQRVFAAAKHHVDPAAIAKLLVHRVQSNKEGLRIAGLPAFKQRIAQTLLEIAKTNTGQVVLEELLASSEVATISYAAATGSQKDNSVQVDAGMQVQLLDLAGNPISTSFPTVLIHELIHQVHEHRDGHAAGKAIMSKRFEYREEENTIAGDPTKASFETEVPNAIIWNRRIELSENAYRAETNQAKRWGHDGEFLDTDGRTGKVLAFEKMKSFSNGQYDDYPGSDAEIDSVCDAMKALPVQYGDTPKEIEGVRTRAHANFATLQDRVGSPELMERLERLYKDANAAIKVSFEEDPELGAKLDAAGLPHALTPLASDQIASMRVGEVQRIEKIVAIMPDWWRYKVTPLIDGLASASLSPRGM